MDTKSEEMIEKVRKILAKVRPDTPEAERNTALATAQRLMARYQLDMSDIERASVDGDAFIHDPRAIVFDKSGPLTRRLIGLACDIASPLGVVAAYHSSRSWEPRVLLWGRRSSIEQVKLLYTALSADALVQAKRLKARRASSVEELDAAREALDFSILPTWASQGDVRRETQSLRMGFIEGYGREIERRLRAVNTEIDSENDGTYLPMLASDYARANAMTPKLGTGTATQSGASAGRAAGKAAGARANLGGSSLPSAPRAIG